MSHRNAPVKTLKNCVGLTDIFSWKLPDFRCKGNNKKSLKAFGYFVYPNYETLNRTLKVWHSEIPVSPYMRPIPYMRPVLLKPTYGSNSNNNSQWWFFLGGLDPKNCLDVTENPAQRSPPSQNSMGFRALCKGAAPATSNRNWFALPKLQFQYWRSMSRGLIVAKYVGILIKCCLQNQWGRSVRGGLNRWNSQKHTHTQFSKKKKDP